MIDMGIGRSYVREHAGKIDIVAYLNHNIDYGHEPVWDTHKATFQLYCKVCSEKYRTADIKHMQQNNYDRAIKGIQR